MKRFTETEKWKDPWFRSLEGAHKLVFLYLVDNCDNAGFYELDENMMSFQTGLSVLRIQGAIKALDRGIKEASGWIWIRRFLRHQKNEQLNPANAFHRQIIRLVKDQSPRFRRFAEFAELEGATKGLASPTGKGTGTGIGKGIGEEGSAEGRTPTLTEQQAVSQATLAGVPTDFARMVFADWEPREGKDAAGVKVKFASYAKKRWGREEMQWKSGHHKSANGTAAPVIPVGQAKSYVKNTSGI